jgi:hypothetical protein
MIKSWHPPDEATAARALAAVVEWLLATTRLPKGDRTLSRAWAAHHDAAFIEAITTFVGLEALILRPSGTR